MVWDPPIPADVDRLALVVEADGVGDRSGGAGRPNGRRVLARRSDQPAEDAAQAAPRR